MKEEYKQSFLRKYGELYTDNKVFVIHVRLGDYENNKLEGVSISLPAEYYYHILAKYDMTKYKVLVISNRVEKAKKMFDDYPDFLVFQDDMIIDFQKIMNADVAIIANSTFSWWAAYLNSKQDKKIYAPKNWLGYNRNKEYPVGIMTDEFYWVDHKDQSF